MDRVFSRELELAALRGMLAGEAISAGRTLRYYSHGDILRRRCLYMGSFFEISALDLA